MGLDIWLECECCGRGGNGRNITHNVTPMWKKARCYDALYNSDGQKAEDIKHVIRSAIRDMTRNFDEYKKLDAVNGWGNAEHAINFLTNLYFDIEQSPKNIIRISK